MTSVFSVFIADNYKPFSYLLISTDAWRTSKFGDNWSTFINITNYLFNVSMKIE